MNTLEKLKKLKETKIEFIPTGTYKIECTSISEEMSNHTHQDYITTSFKIIDGDYEGKSFRHNFNIEGTNDWARNNAIRLLNSLLELYPDIKALGDIKGTVIEAEVEHYIPKNDNYPESNRLKKVYRLVQEIDEAESILASIRNKVA